MALIQIWSCDIDRLDSSFFEKELRILPRSIQNEISRYQRPADQQLRIAARYMLRSSLKQNNLLFNLNDWQTDAHKKPFIPGHFNFNISHSHRLSIIAVATSPIPIGIDIEKKKSINTQALSTFLHPEEEEWISNSSSRLQSFYTIWVKKEAALKAIGTGLLPGLKEFSCIHDSVSHRGKPWYFFPIHINQEYCCCICTPIPLQIQDLEFISIT